MPPRPPAAASIACTSRRCTARRPSGRCSRTICAKRSSAASCAVHYQPIVRAAGEEISGFEALVRWQHPTRGPISPDKFIPLAEEAGLIGKIGEWVLRTALEEAAQWPDHVRVAVNLSPLQFNDPAVVAMVAKHLRETGVRADRLELEITEGVFLAEGESTDETFAKLKELGVRLALDDFGTGYQLARLFEKGAVRQDQDRPELRPRRRVEPTNRNAAIIRAIVTLAETLGMDTCAEGVETHDDLQLIRELGVSMVQGYIFGKPSPPRPRVRLPTASTMEAAGFACIREPRHRLMRRAITSIDGDTIEFEAAQHLVDGRAGRMLASGRAGRPNWRSTSSASARCAASCAGRKRASSASSSTGQFDLTRLAPKKEKRESRSR